MKCHGHRTAIKSVAQVVIFGVVVAFILFCDLWGEKNYTTSKKKRWLISFTWKVNACSVVWFLRVHPMYVGSIPYPMESKKPQVRMGLPMFYIISLWNFVSSVRFNISYHHEISCRLSDVHSISCQDVYVKAKGFMPTRHQNPFWYFISNSSIVVCRRSVFHFEPCDGAALCCPGSVCDPANGWSSIQREQTSSEWKKINLRSMRWSAAVLLVMGSWRLISSSTRP